MKTPNHAEKGKTFRGPENQRPFQAWRSSWGEGLKEVSDCAIAGCGDGKRTLVNVGEDTTLGDGDVAKKLVQLLIVADGKLKMTGDDAGLLVVTGSVTGQLEDFGREVLKHSGEVDGSTSTDTLGVVALAEKTVDTTDGESETGLGRTTEEVS